MAEALKLTRRETMLLGLHFLALFLIPYLPRSVLILTDYVVIRLVLLAALIASAYVSPVMAIATFVLIAFLFIQRNERKMAHLEQIMQQSTPESPAIADIESPPTAPAQPAFDIPSVKAMQFMPQNDSGDDSFKPVAETINAKVPLPTEQSNDGSQKAIDQLFEWVHPNLAQEASP
jgi:hypothetical protein